jgi:hypothetical protein
VRSSLRSSASRSLGRSAKEGSSRLRSDDSTDQIESSLAAASDASGQRAAVRFVDDDELRAPVFKIDGASLVLDEVGADDGERMAVEDRLVDGQISFEPLDGAAQDQFGFDVELAGQFALPLLGQMRRAEHRHGADFAAIVQFAGDERGFDGLADAHVVGDEQSDRIEPQRHHERHELIGTRLDGDASETPERAGGGAGREPRRVAEQSPGPEVAEVASVRERKGGRLHRFDAGQDADHLLVKSAHGPYEQRFVVRLRKHHPFSSSRSNEGPWLGERRAHCAGPPKMSGYRSKMASQSSSCRNRITA